MSIIDKFKKKDEPKPPAQPQTQEIEPDDPNRKYIDAFSPCIGVARLRQIALNDFLDEQGSWNWNIDFTTGFLQLGNHEYPFQFLGTESTSSNSWMWGVNNINGFPEERLVAVNEFYSCDFFAELPELKETELALDDVVNGHSLASAAAARSEELVCYYRCPYDGGAAYVLVEGLPKEIFAVPAAETLISQISQIIGSLPVNHRLLVKGIADAVCTDVVENESGFQGKLGNSVLHVEFDTLGRITKMNAEVKK